MSHIRRIAHQNKTMLLKTASYYVIHICVAAMVAYAVTGNLLASLTLSLLEPTRRRGTSYAVFCLKKKKRTQDTMTN